MTDDSLFAEFQNPQDTWNIRKIPHPTSRWRGLFARLEETTNFFPHAPMGHQRTSNVKGSAELVMSTFFQLRTRLFVSVVFVNQYEIELPNYLFLVHLAFSLDHIFS